MYKVISCSRIRALQKAVCAAVVLRGTAQVSSFTVTAFCTVLCLKAGP